MNESLPLPQTPVISPVFVQSSNSAVSQITSLSVQNSSVDNLAHWNINVTSADVLQSSHCSFSLHGIHPHHEVYTIHSITLYQACNAVHNF